MNKKVEQNALHTTFHSNADETEFTINTYQDVEPVLEENKKAYNNYGDLLTPGKAGEGEEHVVVAVATTLFARRARPRISCIVRRRKRGVGLGWAPQAALANIHGGADTLAVVLRAAVCSTEEA